MPQVFGRYILTQKIALGGMAEVFRARRREGQRAGSVVAIKRILPHFSEDSVFVTMFHDEAKLAGQLRHANVVQVHDFAQVDGLYYLAMEYVAGRDLKRVLDQGVRLGRPLPVTCAVHIIREAALGLHYAHTRVVDGQPLQIVHRDVSPQNILVSFDGAVKITDFGIAKAESRSTKTRAGTVKGKCAYMSPEQARGKPLDARSDLFALGVCLWELLTGKRLFVGESDFDTLNNVLKAEIPTPSAVDPDIPSALDAIVMTALQRDREARHPDCAALADALGTWQRSQPTHPDVPTLQAHMHALFADEISQLHEELQAEAALSFTPDPAVILATAPTEVPADLPTPVAEPPPRPRWSQAAIALLVAAAVLTLSALAVHSR